jgi:hypothetical protein
MRFGNPSDKPQSSNIPSTGVQLKWPLCFPARMAMAAGTAPETLPGASAKGARAPGLPDRAPLFVATLAVAPLRWSASAGTRLWFRAPNVAGGKGSQGPELAEKK